MEMGTVLLLLPPTYFISDITVCQTQIRDVPEAPETCQDIHTAFLSLATQLQCLCRIRCL